MLRSKRIRFKALIILLMFFLFLVWFSQWGFALLIKKYILELDFFKKNNLTISYERLFIDQKGTIVFKNLAIRKIEGKTLWDLSVAHLKMKPNWVSMIRGRWVLNDLLAEHVQLVLIDKKNKQKKCFVQKIDGNLEILQDHQKHVHWSGIWNIHRLVLEKFFYIEKTKISIQKKRILIGPFKLHWQNKWIKGKAMIKINQKEKFFWLNDQKLMVFLKMNAKSGMMLIKNKENESQGWTKIVKERIVYGETSFYPELYENYFSGKAKEIFKAFSFGDPILGKVWYWNGNGDLIIKTKEVKIFDCLIHQVEIGLSFYRKDIYIKNMDFKVGQGSIQGFGVLRGNEGEAGGIIIEIKKIDIQSLSRSFFRDRGSIEGQLNGKILFIRGGSAKRPWMLGGRIKVLNADLWNMNLMRGVLKVFQKVFPNLGKVRFKNSNADFLVKSGKLYIQKLRMVSEWVVLEMKGLIDLKTHELNLDVSFSLKPLGLRDETILSKVISNALMMTGKQVWKAEIRGTWEDPVVIPKFLSILEPLEKILVHPLKDMFQN